MSQLVENEPVHWLLPRTKNFQFSRDSVMFCSIKGKPGNLVMPRLELCIFLILGTNKAYLLVLWINVGVTAGYDFLT